MPFSSGPRSRTPGRGETAREMTSEDIPLATVEVDASVASVDVLLDGTADEVSTVVVDEQAITAAVKATQYNKLEDLIALLDSGAITPDTKDLEECTLLQWVSLKF